MTTMSSKLVCFDDFGIDSYYQRILAFIGKCITLHCLAEKGQEISVSSQEERPYRRSHLMQASVKHMSVDLQVHITYNYYIQLCQ